MQDSQARRRRRSIAGLLLLALGLTCVIFAITAGRMAQPPAFRLDPDGVTPVQRTYFFHNQWVLFGAVDDPRRPPSLDEIGCAPDGDLSRPPQPADMTQYGSRVLDGASLAAIEVLSRSGEDASIVCEGADDYEPLWLAPSSAAPAFTPTAFGIVGALLIVAAVLTHPAMAELSLRRLRDTSRHRRS